MGFLSEHLRELKKEGLVAFPMGYSEANLAQEVVSGAGFFPNHDSLMNFWDILGFGGLWGALTANLQYLKREL